MAYGICCCRTRATSARARPAGGKDFTALEGRARGGAFEGLDKGIPLTGGGSTRNDIEPLSGQVSKLEKLAKAFTNSVSGSHASTDGLVKEFVSSKKAPEFTQLTLETKNVRDGAAKTVLTYRDDSTGEAARVERIDQRNGTARVSVVARDSNGTRLAYQYREDQKGKRFDFHDLAGSRESLSRKVTGGDSKHFEYPSKRPTDPPRRPEKAPSTNARSQDGTTPDIVKVSQPERLRTERPERVSEHRIDKDTVDLIKRHEGNGLPGKPFQRYLDAVGVLTIGYGHARGRGETLPAQITEAEAEDLLRADIRKTDEAINRLVKVRLSAGQKRALNSFVFNLGSGRLSRSTLLKLLNKGNYKGAAGEFQKWNKGKNPKTGKLVSLPGLTKRRDEERREFSRAEAPTSTSVSVIT